MIRLSKTTLFIAAIALVILLISVHVSAQFCDNDSPCPSEICDDQGNCYPRTFQATNEFQVVKEGQDIPRGLHVRIDFATGLKEAKLMDQDDSSDTSVIILDEETDKTTYIPESLLDPSAQRVLKAPSSEGNPKYLANVGDDDLFNACVMVLADADTTSAEAFQALEALEELVHQIDFGVRFAEGEGMEETIRWLENTDPAVKGKVAMVISAAVQNNPTVQRLATINGLVERLVKNMYSEASDAITEERLIYALSNLVRGYPWAIRRLLRDLTLENRLLYVYSNAQRTAADELTRRTATMFTDILDPDMGGLNPAAILLPKTWDVDEDNLDNQDPADVAAKVRYVLESWQNAFDETLEWRSASLDTKEKVMAAVETIKGVWEKV